MFAENRKAEQRKLFTIENDMNKRLKKKLEKHWSGIFFRNVFLKIDEHAFSALYSQNNGRPNFPVNILVSLEILKEMLNLTDEQLFERFSFDVAFRRAMGIEDFSEYAMAEKTLYNFRAALWEYEHEHGENLMEPVFRLLRDDLIKELGIKTGTQRIDSTLIGANIKKMGRLMLFHKTLSNLVRDMKEEGIEISKNIEEVVREDEDHFTYRMARSEYTAATQKIALYLYRLTASHQGDRRICEKESYRTAERLLKEQCDITRKKKVLLKEAEKISSSSLQNPSDVDATYRRKNGEGHQGYAVHAVETCDEGNPLQVVMDVELTANNVDDAAVLAPAIKEYREANGLDTLISDGGFVSDAVRMECAIHGVNLVSTAIRGRAPDESPRLTYQDFLCDTHTGEILLCPAGKKPRSTYVSDTTSVANFDPALCARCKKQHICPAVVSSTQSRYVIDAHRRWLDERYTLMKTDEYQKLCKLRPPVEGLMSQLKGKYLKGRTVFRGRIKVKNRMILRAIGINFRRYWAYWLNNFFFTIENCIKFRVFFALSIKFCHVQV